MTDRERSMIEGYIPSPPDPELQIGEYYVLDARDRPTKVHIVNIAPTREQMIYQVFTESGKLVHGPWETDTETFGGGWYAKGSLYDNKEDCRNDTHISCDFWEDLREIQRKEGMI